MRDDCKFFWLFLPVFMCFIASVSHTRAATLTDGACDEFRFQGQGKLLILSRETIIDRHELELEELKIERDALIRKLDITPVTTSLDYQVSNTSSLTSPLSKYKSETSSVSLKYDLNKISEEAKRTLIKNNIDTDLDSINELLSDIETGKMANKMIKALKKSKGVQIFIGSNTNFFKNTNLSMILSNYKTKNGLTGAIGVIGPKRIDYQRIVPIVSYMSETISKK